MNRYLHSIGVNPKGAVVQRGLRNYAGSHCPGKAWSCTKARKVVQISRARSGRTLAKRGAEPTGQNRVVCNPGTISDTGPGLPTPGKNCDIVQIAQTQADNVATCIVTFSTPGATEGCTVTQQNVDGRNRVTIDQLARQRDLSTPPQGGIFDQVAIQGVIVEQLNGQGDNTAQITQAIDQRIMSGAAAISPQHASGAADGIDLYQQGTGENRADLNEAYGQVMQNLGSQVSDIEVGIQGITVSQCGASAGLCVQGSAKQTLHMHQSFSQVLNAPNAVGGFQGQAAAPFEEPDCPAANGSGAAICGSVTQLSAGVSSAFVKQSGFQSASAPKTSHVAERQDDPYRCCSGQFVNPSNVFQIGQDRTQLANSAIYTQLADQMEGTCDTSGSCAVHQRSNQNGSLTQNSCTGSFCDITIVCPAGGGTCTAGNATTVRMLARRRG